MEKIIISGEIGWDVMPKDIMSQLEAAKGKDIEVHMASPGGFVFDGIEIYNAFKDYKRKYPEAQMMMTIKGLAASMASYLAVNPAFDMVVAEDNAVFMIHNVWGGTVGDYRDMKKAAEIFEGLTDLLGQAYSTKTGKKKKEVRCMMDEESWFFGSEILDAGFVDEIIKTPEKKEKNSAFANAKLSFSSMSEKLAKSKTDYTQLAAMIKPTTEESHPATNAGNNNITEVKLMSLKEILDQNPAAKAEYEKELGAKYEAGKKDAQEVAAKAAIFATSKEYPEQVKNVALEVMQGKKSIESLEVLAAQADMIKEMMKSAAAVAEQTKGTPAAEPEKLSTDGVARTEADIKSVVSQLKGGIN